ncbi:helix-turn-helix domain-containing protein, partial [Streptomyces sp. NPDC002144]
GEYLLGGATSSSFPCSGQPYWVPVRKPRGPSETAVACGWSNPSSFIDAFTEVVGQTPGRYQADLRHHHT